MNSFAVSSERVKRFEGKFAESKKRLPELAAFKVIMLGEKKHNHSKSSCGNCKPQIA